MKFGMIENEPINDYHLCGALSHSKLEWFRYSPELFEKYFISKTLPIPKPTDSMETGIALHTWILDGFEAFLNKFEGMPEEHDGRYVDGKARLEKIKLSGKKAIKFDDMESIKAANAKCGVAIRALGKTLKEVSFRIDCGKFALQCRPDIFDPLTLSIYDLKSCSDFEQFEKNFVNLGYFRQAALYCNIVSQVITSDVLPSFTFIAQEMNAPYRCRLYPVSPEVMEIGTQENIASIEDYKKRLENNDFREVLEPKVLALPYWYTKGI